MGVASLEQVVLTWLTYTGGVASLQQVVPALPRYTRWAKSPSVYTHPKGICFFPWDGRPPAGWPQFFRQRLRHGHHDEKDVQQRHSGGDPDDDCLAVQVLEISPQCRTGDQAGSKGGWYLGGEDTHAALSETHFCDRATDGVDSAVGESHHCHP